MGKEAIYPLGMGLAITAQRLFLGSEMFRDNDKESNQCPRDPQLPGESGRQSMGTRLGIAGPKRTKIGRRDMDQALWLGPYIIDALPGRLDIPEFRKPGG